MSLRAKLVLWYTAVFAISGALLTGALYLLTAHVMEAEADKFLAEEFDEVRDLTLEKLPNVEELRTRIAEEMGGERYFPLGYRLRDRAAGKDLVLVAPKGFHAALASDPAGDTGADSDAYGTLAFGDRGRRLRVLTGPLHATRYPNLVLQVGMHNRWVEKRTASLRKYLLGVLVAVVLVAAAGGWVLASRSLRPIDRIAADLSRVESTNLAARLAVGSSGDEVARLRGAINRMLERLEAAFDRLQSFTADAAHELRTPLAALQCRLETAISRPRSEAEAREALTDALHQVAELASLVENLLLLARMDAEQALRTPAPVDLAALLRDIGEPFALLAEQKDIALSVEADGPVVTDGDPTLLRRVFGNLLDNALRYTPSGGRVTARAAPDGAGCVVAVADTGIGIRPEALGHVFERFYRTDESRSRTDGGAGLGLSIAKRAVELHRGRITIESTPGKGTTVTVWLPQGGEGPPSARPGTA
ncbi:MAG TPA: HAMP domain-containing sensor histidine kinase [Planctomycetota bacterium]|nr:HAMP domain-containing sensor histidine kinase [Planctomycetota bacterium]